LSRSLIAGPLSIEVSAPNFQSLMDEVDIAPGLNITRYFRLEPLKGAMMITCEPEDCSLRINGVSSGNIAHRRWELTGLLSREYEVEVRAEGFKSAKGKFRVTAPRPAPSHSNGGG
jgi:hypothetical protein